MADTIRTRASLLTLLADNATGDISANDVRDFLVSTFGVYGAIYIKDGSTAQTDARGLDGVDEQRALCGDES